MPAKKIGISLSMDQPVLTSYVQSGGGKSLELNPAHLLPNIRDAE
jgi:hypothetical protein